MQNEAPVSTEFTFDEEAFRRKVPFNIEPTNLPGVFSIPAPPDGFDPRRANSRELMRNGILWRNAGDLDEARGAALDRFMACDWKAANHIVPEMVVKPMRPRALRPAALSVLNGPPPNGVFTSFNWGGAAYLTGGWQCVQGMWSAPLLSTPNEPAGLHDGGWDSSSWIGLDGIGLDKNGHLTGGTDVLQAGIVSNITSSKPEQKKDEYYAWYEWFTPQMPNSPPYINPIQIMNFPVMRDDVIYCQIQYLGILGAVVKMANQTSGKTFSIVLAAPPGSEVQGQLCGVDR